ncbi:hypothetical protein A8F94_12790 [Bacillus sp. FJAT-27225]|uniref:hypothetical protein n=1 Tax=Bacillus sp. FJAT-27225 TaxID=1743144 RepID=UPI00080C2A13|nr:hypothetical protein [Bacillus sp. FJAT-27225]OCA85744.1 hypothetical protein A8F94_12790 [Bacillus sp. FJAT-27225]
MRLFNRILLMVKEWMGTKVEEKQVEKPVYAKVNGLDRPPSIPPNGPLYQTKTEKKAAFKVIQGGKK